MVIAGERQGHTVRQILEQFKTGYGELDVGLSVVTIVELTHGVQRAGTEERRQRRQAFVDELIRDVLRANPRPEGGETVTRRRCGRVSRFSLDALLNISTALGCRVRVDLEAA